MGYRLVAGAASLAALLSTLLNIQPSQACECQDGVVLSCFTSTLNSSLDRRPLHQPEVQPQPLLRRGAGVFAGGQVRGRHQPHPPRLPSQAGREGQDRVQSPGEDLGRRQVTSAHDMTIYCRRLTASSKCGRSGTPTDGTGATRASGSMGGCRVSYKVVMTSLLCCRRWQPYQYHEDKYEDNNDLSGGSTWLVSLRMSRQVRGHILL